MRRAASQRSTTAARSMSALQPTSRSWICAKAHSNFSTTTRGRAPAAKGCSRSRQCRTANASRGLEFVARGSAKSAWISGAELSANGIAGNRETVVVSAVVAYRLLQNDRKTAAARQHFDHAPQLMSLGCHPQTYNDQGELLT